MVLKQTFNESLFYFSFLELALIRTILERLKLSYFSLFVIQKHLSRMWTRVQLPYFRPVEELPGPLSTQEEIKSSTTFLGQRITQQMVRAN